ncbi:dead/DEAH box helicase, putative [Leishmania tarentolae]|uniref:Dead/DEAH box helicase, putative n=1 Tax=Leishmania tarentolae TaxID=5689 RepID=A0A640KQ08_LEITA|nr:dead/DEAH box helicase, putative [Leishmania tarentolae]
MVFDISSTPLTPNRNSDSVSQKCSLRRAPVCTRCAPVGSRRGMASRRIPLAPLLKSIRIIFFLFYQTVLMLRTLSTTSFSQAKRMRWGSSARKVTRCAPTTWWNGWTTHCSSSSSSGGAPRHVSSFSALCGRWTLSTAMGTIPSLRRSPAILFDDSNARTSATAPTHAAASELQAPMPKPLETSPTVCATDSLTPSSAPLRPPRRCFITCKCCNVRGLDLPHLTHVLILAQPATALEYAHWCGRVGRFGRSGVSVTLMARNATRRMHQFCDSLGIAFCVERRHAEVDVHAERWLSGADTI